MKIKIKNRTEHFKRFDYFSVIHNKHDLSNIIKKVGFEPLVTKQKENDLYQSLFANIENSANRIDSNIVKINKYNIWEYISDEVYLVNNNSYSNINEALAISRDLIFLTPTSLIGQFSYDLINSLHNYPSNTPSVNNKIQAQLTLEAVYLMYIHYIKIKESTHFKAKLTSFFNLIKSDLNKIAIGCS